MVKLEGTDAEPSRLKDVNRVALGFHVLTLPFVGWIVKGLFCFPCDRCWLPLSDVS